MAWKPASLTASSRALSATSLSRATVAVFFLRSISNSLISEGAYIYGKVENSVIFPGVVVEEGAYVKDSIVMQETHIGRGTRILRAIVDEEVRVGENCVIGGEGAIAVIGCRVQVGNDVVVDAGRAVSPGETLA